MCVCVCFGAHTSVQLARRTFLISCASGFSGALFVGAELLSMGTGSLSVGTGLLIVGGGACLCGWVVHGCWFVVSGHSGDMLSAVWSPLAKDWMGRGWGYSPSIIV